MASLWDQVTFSSSTDCDLFIANALKPDLCRECMQRITSHSREAVSEEQLRIALDHLPAACPASHIQLNDDSSQGQLWLGSFKAVEPGFVSKHNIQLVITVAKGIEQVWPVFGKHCAAVVASGVTRLQLDWIDSASFTMPLEDLQRAAEAIHTARCQGHNVLVHCAQGKSRSSSVLLYYCMTHAKLDYDTALRLIQSFRPMASPNPGFERQLRSL
eukprot:m.23762 g.23762  ORF g.23762 m.23762 type:complete len:215 (-) comp11425_c0_seq2:418-1062(-)